jgi:oxygen-independent coproporphyrinogen-3 oxidase
MRHYEVSNYARKGEEARHNLGYWRGEEYLGLGCAAYGFVGVTRYRNPIDPRAYMAGRESPTVEELDGTALLRERIMLGLRLVGGLDLDEAARGLGVDPWTKERRRAIEKLVASGRLERSDAPARARLRIPPRAWLWADDTAARLF